MKDIHLLKIIASSYDSNKELKDRKVDKLISNTKCYVIGKFYGQPMHDERLLEEVEWYLDADLIDSYNSRISDTATSYDIECGFIFKALIDHIQLYVGHNKIIITTSKTNIVKAFSAVQDLANYLTSSDAKYEFTNSSLDDFKDYIAYDLEIFSTTSKFGKVLYNNLSELIIAFMSSEFKLIFDISHYVYKSYHRGLMDERRLKKYLRAGKLSASHVINKNKQYNTDAEVSNKTVKTVKRRCDKLAGFTSSDVDIELTANRLKITIESIKRGNRLWDILFQYCGRDNVTKASRIFNVIVTEVDTKTCYLSDHQVSKLASVREAIEHDSKISE